jgi:CRP/FNR family transcriptional regulator, cyclic AMP receptor protein
VGKSGSELSSAALARGLASQTATKRTTLDRHGVALLETMPLFAGLSSRHLRRIAGLAEQVRFGAGRTVAQNGSRGTAFYVIIEGEVKVTAGYSNRAFARLGPGDFFGELALLDGGPRTASVVAETPLVTIRIARSEFRTLLKSEPDVALKILEELSCRLANGAVGVGVTPRLTTPRRGSPRPAGRPRTRLRAPETARRRPPG